MLLVATDSFVDARRQPTISPEKKIKKRELFFVVVLFFCTPFKVSILEVKSLMSFLAWLCRVVDNRIFLYIL